MGTSLAAGGTVRALVATQWYDDGPHDLAGQLAFLVDGSDFVCALGTLPASKIVARLRNELRGAAITPHIVCKLAGDYLIVQQRPELILPLLPHLGDTHRLDPWSRMALVSLVGRAGDTEAAIALFEPLVRELLKRPFRFLPYDVLGDVARQLIDLGLPHRALRLIHPSHVGAKSWQHVSVNYLSIAVCALRALGRPVQALELARIAMSKGGKGAVSQICELEQELGQKGM